MTRQPVGGDSGNQVTRRAPHPCRPRNDSRSWGFRRREHPQHVQILGDVDEPVAHTLGNVEDAACDTCARFPFYVDRAAAGQDDVDLVLAVGSLRSLALHATGTCRPTARRLGAPRRTVAAAQRRARAAPRATISALRPPPSYRGSKSASAEERFHGVQWHQDVGRSWRRQRSTGVDRPEGAAPRRSAAWSVGRCSVDAAIPAEAFRSAPSPG